jgi:hypothetical protein
MFKTFNFKSLAAFALVAAAVCTAAADPASARKKKVMSEGMPYETVTQGNVRDHRTQPVVRDHRTQPKVRDHRKRKVIVSTSSESGGISVQPTPGGRKVVKLRDHRKKKFFSIMD